MTPYHRRLVRLAATALLCAVTAGIVSALTVEKIPLERLTRESGIVVRGVVLTTGARWAGRTIHTETTIRVTDRLKGDTGETILVTQLGGTVGEVSAEVPGTPVLRPGEEVVLFLTPWQGRNWIHSVVLGKFSVIATEAGSAVVNDLRNIGLVDPSTGREIEPGDERQQTIPLVPFLDRVRAVVAREAR